MPATHSKFLDCNTTHRQGDVSQPTYCFNFKGIPKKGWSVRGVAIELVNGRERPVLLFGPAASAEIRTPSIQDFAAALRLVYLDSTRPKFEFVTIDPNHPYAGRHYNHYSPSWLKGTSLGRTLFKADEEMKMLKHRMNRAEDGSYVSRDPTFPGLKGPNHFPYNYIGSSPIYLTCRSVKIAKTARLCEFLGEPQMQITLDSNPLYSEYISSLYATIGHGDAPAFLEAREVPKLLLAAEWIKEKGFKVSEDWIKMTTRPALPASSPGEGPDPLCSIGPGDVDLQSLSEMMPKVNGLPCEGGSMDLQVTSVQASHDRLSMEMTQTIHREDGSDFTLQKSLRMSVSDDDWLLEGQLVKMLVASGVVPAEESWSDLREATIAPYWSAEFDEDGEKVVSMSSGGCSMTSFTAEPSRVKRKEKSQSRAWEQTPVAGGAYTTHRNGYIGAVGRPESSKKVVKDDEIAELKRAAAASARKAELKVPKWDGAKSGSSRGSQDRLLGAVNRVTGTGDYHDERGRRVLETQELRTRMDIKTIANGKEVAPPETVFGRLSTARGVGIPTLPLSSHKSKPQKKVPLPPDLVTQLKATFKCTLCSREPMTSPVLATSCCGKILGCQGCVDHYYATGNTHCPACHAVEGYKNTFCLHGVDEILQALSNGVAGVDSAVFAESLKCTVCHSAPLSSQPAVCTGCGRIIGCSDCIKQWHSTKDQCPLCSKDGGRDNTIRLPGMGPILQALEQFFRVAELRSP